MSSRKPMTEFDARARFCHSLSNLFFRESINQKIKKIFCSLLDKMHFIWYTMNGTKWHVLVHVGGTKKNMDKIEWVWKRMCN